jgi:allantoate deiminase
MDFAAQVMERLDALGRISETPDRLSRPFASPAMRRANDLVGSWMVRAGMTVKTDAIGNLIGRLPGPHPGAKILLMGSHLDTVPNAGKYDGPLGVALAIACVAQIRAARRPPPFAIDVIGFADEEGVRYQTAFLGSRALTGQLRNAELALTDANGVTMADAIRKFGADPSRLQSSRMNARNLLGYIEVHIEQGPVLEKRKLGAGIVTAIAGQTRATVTFHGRAGHAGATPMNLRRDALCAAAEFVRYAENYARQHAGLVATVGQIAVEPNAGNVIPGLCRLSLDARHQQDLARTKCCDQLRKQALKIGRGRCLQTIWKTTQETASVPCSAGLSALLQKALRRHQSRVINIPSGAGHDAAIMARIAPVAMLFVRCAGGVSHHPDESVKTNDVRLALNVLTDFVHSLPPA